MDQRSLGLVIVLGRPKQMYVGDTVTVPRVVEELPRILAQVQRVAREEAVGVILQCVEDDHHRRTQDMVIAAHGVEAFASPKLEDGP